MSYQTTDLSLRRHLMRTILPLTFSMSITANAYADVFISEIHYDNDGTDVGEAIELSGPTEISLDGWSLVLYNGNNGQAYDTITLSGSLQSVDGCEDAYSVVEFPSNGIQNGSPDAIALIDPLSTVIEFLSYEGEFVAENDIAVGISSTDIGVSETSSTPVGYSLQKIDGVWMEPQENTFGGCSSEDLGEETGGEADGGTDDGGTDDGGDVQTVFIHQIQGVDDELAISGSVKVEAIVTASYQDASQLSGFFIQEENIDTDTNSATSEGLFVYCADCEILVAVGDKVEVVGEASDFFSMTQITAQNITVLAENQPLPSASTITLPLQTDSLDVDSATGVVDDFYERYEGMLLSIESNLTVTETFNLGRYGEIMLSANGRIRQYTDANIPTEQGYIAQQIDRIERVIVLDDASTQQNNDPVFYPTFGLSFDSSMRGGDTIEHLTGVLNYSFSTWRIQPVTEIYDYNFVSINPRENLEPDTSADITVASFNVLNYFITLDEGDNICGANANLECRGADSEEEFTRQESKLISALCELDADVVGLMELENPSTENTEQTAVQRLTEALNVECGPYASIDTGAVGTDAIAVGIIYKPENITPVGETAILNTLNFINPNSHDTEKNRPAIAQSFEYFQTQDAFTVVVNHLKSKGSDCEGGLDPNDDDTTTGQGNCNGTRTKAAEAEIAWLATYPTGIETNKVLVIGDLNAYRNEDPISAFKNTGYTDVIDLFSGDDAYGYVFDGEWGYLDHALVSDEILSHVTSARDWHINADENILLDYNSEFKPNTYEVDLYRENAYRSSDHDPVLIGLSFSNENASVEFGEIMDAFDQALENDEIVGVGFFTWWQKLTLKTFSFKLLKTEYYIDRDQNELACYSLQNLITFSDGEKNPSDLIQGTLVSTINSDIVQFFDQYCDR